VTNVGCPEMDKKLKEKKTFSDLPTPFFGTCVTGNTTLIFLGLIVHFLNVLYMRIGHNVGYLV
jgi:hypothetical protein